MDILYLLIPLSVVLVFGILVVFAWALKSGQFDDLEREGLRLLGDDTSSASTGRAIGVDTNQAARVRSDKESAPNQTMNELRRSNQWQ
ncbi:cbb3-type cytochrome oxidase assembly protein CcoS [Leptothrix discophora]|uniref:Cbb3-type cytochrome oxidase assembly protein CcoS n=1 Tax=Leptothrix discophora TaxID=89 RepID=A0ABT9FXR8_LEPDI|nr:cbb3-type cytochrome oxidase assembly protein CcoS [Leptothrix discophora]MDP4299026.1 cbb3-type cytochrome oxidase assembly protein CcoS [Leptothrix discophora]